MFKEFFNPKGEDLINLPNFLTAIRFLLTFVLIYMFLNNFQVLHILAIFIVAAFTDLLDGKVARRHNTVTDFGAKFDIMSDRFLWISMGLLVLVTFYSRDLFNGLHIFQIFIIMTREILCAPFVFINLFRGKSILTPAQLSGKVTTFLQGLAIPLLVLSIYYPVFDNVVFYLSILSGVSGIWAATDYSTALGFFGKKKK